MKTMQLSASLGVTKLERIGGARIPSLFSPLRILTPKLALMENHEQEKKPSSPVSSQLLGYY